MTPAGGTAPYTYSWSNGAVTQDLTGIGAGTYTVNVTDVNGLTGGCFATTSVTITQPAAPLTVTSTRVNVLCFGASTGSIDLSPAGGTAPYTYAWSNGAVTQDLTNIPAGTYTVVVTDANGSTGGCTATTTVIITQPAAALTVSTTQVNVLCFGGTTGSINLTPAGGTPAYTYAWSNGAVTQDLSGLAAGTYTVNVTDANGSTGGCTATTSVTITQPAAPLTVSTTQVNILCNGGTTGSIDLTPAGGTAPYTYSWSNGAVTQDLTGIGAGTYTVNVTDVNGLTGGCFATTSVTITQPAAPLTVTSTRVNVLCFGASTGSIDLSPAGGTAPYTYAWSNGAVTQDLTNIPAGTYTVVVTDANGSTGGCTATTTVIITQPAAALTVSTTQVNVLCFGGTTGSINLTPAGGTPAYTYAWSNGAVTQDLSGLAAGTYTVNVTDANGSTGGCTATTSVTITQPAAPLTVSTTQVNILCNGGTTGSIDLTPAGGTAPYTYSWSNGAVTQDLTGIAAGTYTVNVTDANGLTGGCFATTTVTITQPPILTQSISSFTYPSGTNISCFGLSDGSVNLTIGGGNPTYTYLWSNGALTEDLSNVPAGTYSVTVTDLNGCSITSTITLTQPTLLTSSLTPFVYAGGFNVSGCVNDGSINLTPAGGNPTYTYLWSNGATTQDVASLAAGTYNVTTTDINGCTSTTSVTLTQPNPLAQVISSFTYPSGTNISCFGLSDGSVDLTISGGTPLYSYLWSNGATTQDLSNVPAGTYSVTVTDANGCTITSSITLTEPVILTSSLDPSIYAGGFNVSGCVADGTIDLTVVGGNPGYTYSWSNGAVIEDISSLISGNYTVTVTDLNGCQTISNITLTQPGGLTQSISAFTYPSGTNISCFGLSDGSIDLTIGGGTPGYTYVWSNGAVTEDLTNLAAGTYGVTVTDQNGCQISSSITLTQPPALTQSVNAFIYPSGNNISCFGLSDGSVNLTVLGGNPAYSYLWSNGAVSQDLTNVPAGTYNVTITDVNGCSIPSTITLTEPTILTQTISAFTYPSGTNISCFGLSDGSIDLTIAGGSPGYTYAWSNGGIIEDLTNLPAGPYNVTVTDINGCTITSSITLTEPSPLTQTISAFTYPSGTNISCFGLSDGSIDLTIGGGNPGYVYDWSNGGASEDLTALPAGVYSVTVTDINGCSIPSTITLTEPPALNQSVTAFTYPSGNNISCFGLSDGSVDLTITGGNPGYTYSWSNGAVSQDLTNVPAGTYNVTITDVNGCSIPSTITLTEPTILTQTISAFTYPSGTNISCFGLSDGSIDLTIAGGSPGYTYAWSNGGIIEDLTNLPAGPYNVTVTDINGCTITSSITLTEPSPLTQTISAFTYPSGTNISCFGLSDGSIDLTIGGGNPGYVYDWSNGGASEDLTALPAGVYSVTVTDINGCSIPSTITLTEPPALNQSVTAFTYPSGNNISCFGLSDGSVDLTITGGNPGYTYSWSNGAITEDLTNVPAGTYTVTVNDPNGCPIIASITLTEPSVLTEAISAFTYPSGTNISCFGFSDGSIDLTIAGGSPGYTYTWSNGGIIEDLTNLPAGPYNVTVTDINGCTITSSITLTEPSPLTQTISAFTYPSGTNISCFGLSDGSIDLTIGGGNPGYVYDWSNGGASEDLTALPAGVYSVTVTDINGCSIPSTITLTEPPALNQSVTAFTYPSGNNISCFGLSDGSVDLTITGGNPGYTYSWSNGAITEDLTNVPAGTYTVTVNDPNGCPIIASITLTEPSVLTEAISAFTYPSGTNISCFGFSDGSIDLTIAGGSPGYTYTWSNGGIIEDLTNLPAGPYNVTVTDINGCTITSSITLTEPSPLTQTISAFTYPSGTNISCFGLSDGSIDLTIGGGNPGYVYDWSNGGASEDLTALPAGVYSVTVTDINGCSIPSTITLTEPPALNQSVTAFTYPSGNNISCFGLSDGSVDLTITGGNPGYTYSWSNGAITEDLTNVPAGTYTVTVNDPNGCPIIASITLTEPSVLTEAISAFTYPSGTNISCFGFSDGSIDLTIAGGSPGYTYTWSNGGIIEDLTNLPAGPYNVTVTDINGCTITSTITLTEPTPLNYSATLSIYAGGFNVTGCNDDGTIDLTVGGSIPGYTYVWSNGSPNEDQANLPAGTYSVNITDANGCLLVVDTTLVAAPIVSATASVVSDYNGQDISCFGFSDGIITVNPAGGVPGYTYQWSSVTNANLSNLQTVVNLPSGNYVVEVTDQNGCTAITNVTLVDPPMFDVNIVVSTNYNGSDITCFGESDGGIDLTVTGAVPGYTYAWSNSTMTFTSATQDLVGLPADTYSVLITDLNGCITSTQIVLTEPEPLLAIPDVVSNYNGQDVSCFQSTDGEITVVPSGGMPGYSVQWLDGNGNPLGTNINQANVGAGIYVAVVTDINGCTSGSPVVVTEPEILFTAPIIISNYFGFAVSCENQTDGIVDSYVSGGTPGYTYSWNTNPVETTAIVSNLGVGTATVTVTDANGCVATGSVELTANPNPTYSLVPQIHACSGMSITLDSGTEPENNCFWVFSDGTFTDECQPTLNFGAVGCYDAQLTVTSPIGCFVTAVVTDFICVEPDPVAIFTPSTLELNEEDNEVFFTNASINADSYVWNFGDESSSTETEPLHVYDVYNGSDSFIVVTLYAYSQYGCVDSTVRQIYFNEGLVYHVPNTFTPDGDEYNNTFQPVMGSGYDPTKGYTFLIFNRWGELIFESHDPEVGWDGTYGAGGTPYVCQSGTYTWKLTFKRNNNDDKVTDVGHVNLLR